MPIFDQGYQHWKGPLSGHAWRWLAVARQGVRAQLRGWLMWLALVVAWLPALALVAALAVWGLLEQKAESALTFLSWLPPDMIDQPQAYRTAFWTIAYQFFFKAELFVLLFFLILAGPALISSDLRFNSLPLYFSRPLTRIDYFLGKLGVIAFFVGVVVILPAVVAYALGVCFSLELGVLKDTHRLLWGSVAYGLIIVVSAGTLMLALSSLSRRSIYVALTWVGLWLVSFTVSGIMIGVHGESIRRPIVEEQMAEWVQRHPPPPGIEMSGPYPVVSYDRSRRRKGARADNRNEEQQRWMEAWGRAYGEAFARGEAAHVAKAREDWRPLCSYSANLDRMGDLILDTDSAWVAVGKAVEKPRTLFGPLLGGRSRPPNERLLADQRVWQHPWQWSAAVLAGLFVGAVCVLSMRVKSLDRLR